MSSLQVRTISRASAPVTTHTARLELLEYYLAHHEDLVRCAQASVDWLARQAAVRRAICLAVDGEASQLVGLAGVGVSVGDVELFSLPLSESHDPLIRALSAPGPTVVRPARINGHGGRGTPLGAGQFAAIPLRGGRDTDDEAVGLLLIRPGAPISADVSWLAAVLGQKIDQIRGRG